MGALCVPWIAIGYITINSKSYKMDACKVLLLTLCAMVIHQLPRAAALWCPAQDINLNLNDLICFPDSVQTWQDCGTICASYVGCKFWTWRAPRRCCLKYYAAPAQFE